MVYMEEITMDEVKSIIASYLQTISDLMDIEFRQTAECYESSYTVLQYGKKEKVISQLRFLDFKSLLELALKSKGYNVLNLYYKSFKKFSGFVLTYSLVEIPDKSR